MDEVILALQDIQSVMRNRNLNDDVIIDGDLAGEIDAQINLVIELVRNNERCIAAMSNIISKAVAALPEEEAQKFALNFMVNEQAMERPQ